MRDYKANWRKKARTLLAEAFGGKCTVCGYDKTIMALDYHHINPKEKDKLLSMAMRDGSSWSRIVKEARKCTIVCCRCHREIHAGVTELPLNCSKFNEAFADVMKIGKKDKEFDDCPVCGNKKFVGYKHCSHACQMEGNRKLRATKEELKQLLNTNTYEAVGKMFGVTGNAVKKRCKALGIYKRKLKVVL